MANYEAPGVYGIKPLKEANLGVALRLICPPQDINALIATTKTVKEILCLIERPRQHRLFTVPYFTMRS